MLVKFECVRSGARWWGEIVACIRCIFLVIYNFADVASVSGSFVPRLVGGGVGGCSRRRLLAGFPKRSYCACDAAGRSVMSRLVIIVVGF